MFIGNLRFKTHDSHLTALQNFIKNNRDVFTDQLIDSLIDAYNCINYMAGNISELSEIVDEGSIDFLEGYVKIIKEFYHFNKYYLNETMKDSLIDAQECMNNVIDEYWENTQSKYTYNRR